MSMKVLALDIETAPSLAYVWQLFKENIPLERLIEPGYTLCYASSWEHDRDNVTFESLFYSEPKDMLQVIWDQLDEADVVIHYNGKKFDMPTLNREFLLHGFTPPSSYRQIDLYQVVRSTYRFQSNKLDFVAQQLGIEDKAQHKGMQLWKDCMAGVDLRWNAEVPPHIDESWQEMEVYNRQDVALLWQVYDRLQPWIRRHPNRALWMAETDRPICPNCGSENVIKKGIERPATVNAYHRYKCKDCGANSRSRLAIKGTPKPEIV